MKKTIYFSFLSLLWLSCVKNPGDITPDKFISIKTNNTAVESASFIADNGTKYLIDVAELPDVEIADDRQITVSVTDGTLATPANLATLSSSSQITIVMEGGKSQFYYQPGKKAQSNASFTFTLQNVNQAASFSIQPSLPESIEIDPTPKTPTQADNVSLTAYLLRNDVNSHVSDNLKVSFTAAPLTSTDDIIPYIAVPGYSFSNSTDVPGFVTAKSSFFTSGTTGKIMIKVQCGTIEKMMPLVIAPKK